MQTRTRRGASTPAATGKHFYQFYKGREDLFRIAIPFLRLGLENNEACLWVVSSTIGLLEAIEVFRHDTDLIHYLGNGQLTVLPAERWYLDRGRFSERKVLARLKRFIEEKELRGFSVYRGVGDVGWIEDRDWFKFQSYEEKIHAWSQESRVTLICAYPIHRCSITQTKDILDHHDRVFLTKL